MVSGIGSEDPCAVTPARSCSPCRFLATAASQEARLPASWRPLAREIFAELIAIDTTHEKGSTAAAQVIAGRLRLRGLAGRAAGRDRVRSPVREGAHRRTPPEDERRAMTASSM